jgi:hypothetical protein
MHDYVPGGEDGSHGEAQLEANLAELAEARATLVKNSLPVLELDENIKALQQKIEAAKKPEPAVVKIGVTFKDVMPKPLFASPGSDLAMASNPRGHAGNADQAADAAEVAHAGATRLPDAPSIKCPNCTTLEKKLAELGEAASSVLNRDVIILDDGDEEERTEKVRISPAEAVAEAHARKKRKVGDGSSASGAVQIIEAQADQLLEVKREKLVLAEEVEDQDEEHTNMTLFTQYQHDAIDRLKAIARKLGADPAEVVEAARVGRR